MGNASVGAGMHYERHQWLARVAEAAAKQAAARRQAREQVAIMIVASIIPVVKIAIGEAKRRRENDAKNTSAV